MRTYKLIIWGIVLFFCSANIFPQGSGWDSVSTILKRIVPPSFPNREFNIISYGAIGDGVTDCTAAIKNAVTACSNSGGGKVIVPGGTFLTGAIYLKSNVNLHLTSGAILLFSHDKSKYLPVVYTRSEGIECMNYSPFIYSYSEINIAVTGRGTLDGQADNSNWWDWKNLSTNDSNLLYSYASKGTPVQERIFGNGHYVRPNFVQPYNCKNILIDSITVLRSPAWEIHPVLSQNVTISNITINSYGPNNDGCDPECCTDVLIKNCYFNTGDDCIAIKSGKNDDGRRVNISCQNIIIKGCHMIDGHGGVTLGSEMTGGIRNVYADSCSMTGSNLNMMLRFKTNTARGGIIENIYARNINELMDTQGSIYVDMFYGGETGNYNPAIRNIFVQNVISSQSKYAIYISDDKNFPLTNLQLTDCTFNNSASGYVLGNAKQVVFKNVKINGITYTAVKNEEALNVDFQLYQNYPNPFNPETNIKYELKTPGYVTLKVYDLLGREVSTLVNEFKQAGVFNSTFSILPTGRQVLNSKICSGLYFYRLTSGEFTATRKMIILK